MTSNWPLPVVMSVVARWRSTFSSRITQFSLMSGWFFSNVADSFFSSSMSGLFSVAIVSVAACVAHAAVAIAAPAAKRAAAVSVLCCMVCLLWFYSYGIGPSAAGQPDRCIPHARAYRAITSRIRWRTHARGSGASVPFRDAAYTSGSHCATSVSGTR